MKTPCKFLAAIVAVFCLSVNVFAAAGPVTGTWKWTVQGRQGGQGFEQVLKLEEKDGKLTGTLVGRDAGQFTTPDTAITDASLVDGTVKFTVTREFNGRSFSTKYEGKLEGDTIKGTYERPGFGGGEPSKTEWIAKRVK